MEKIKVLVVAPGEKPRIQETETDLASLQAIVGGNLEAVFPWPEDMTTLVACEDGKLRGFPPNRMLEDYDILVGTFFIAGLGEEDFASLPDDLIEKYTEKFYWPQIFMRTEPGTILMISEKPGSEPRVIC